MIINPATNKLRRRLGMIARKSTMITRLIVITVSFVGLTIAPGMAAHIIMIINKEANLPLLYSSSCHPVAFAGGGGGAAILYHHRRGEKRSGLFLLFGC